MSRERAKNVGNRIVELGAPVPRTPSGAEVAADRLEEAGFSGHATWLRHRIYSDVAARTLRPNARRQLRRLSKYIVDLLWCRKGWWRRITGEWVRITDMDNGHLLNSIQMLLYGGPNASPKNDVEIKRRYVPLMQEVVRRGLLPMFTSNFSVRRNYSGREPVLLGWGTAAQEFVEWVRNHSGANAAAIHQAIETAIGNQAPNLQNLLRRNRGS